MISLSELSLQCNSKQGRTLVNKELLEKLVAQLSTANDVEKLKIGLILIKLSIDHPTNEMELLNYLDWIRWLQTDLKDTSCQEAGESLNLVWSNS